MTERQKKYLSDVIYSIELIEQLVSEVSSFSEYENDAKTKSAVERHLGSYYLVGRGAISATVQN
jgi:uncharacterized protein with HEPN domain